MSMGEKIQALRQAAGLSQEQLAERMEVSRQSVSKWESGRSRPDMDKLVMLAQLFSVSTDYFLKESDPPSSPSAAKRCPGFRTLAAALAALLALAICTWLGLQLYHAQAAAGQLQAENQRLIQDGAQLKADLASAQTALADKQAEKAGSFEALEAYYYQFAQTYRLDYVPEFSYGDPPTESPAYLMYAFAVNLDNWGEQKGLMSKTYVDDIALRYFNQPSIAHMSARKAWDFDGARYTALPQGINPAPVYFLHSYETCREADNVYYTVVLDRCIREEGEIDPAELGLDSLPKLLEAYTRDSFHPVERETFVYYISSYMAGGNPVFISHESSLPDEAAQQP